MRIFFVSRGVPSKANPMLGIFEVDQAKALQALGHEVVFLSIDLRSIRRKRKFGFNSYIHEGLNIEEVSIPLGRVPRQMLLSLGEKAFYKLIKRAIGKYGMPDVVHSHFVDISCMTAKGLKRLMPVEMCHIMTEHSSKLNSDISPKDLEVYREAYESSNAVITVSTALQNRLEHLFGVKSTCIHNIVDLDVFSYVPHEASNGPFRFTSVGALRKVKNMESTIKAFSSLCEKIDDAELVIIGEGPERKSLEQLIRELDLSEKVKLTGMLKREQIKEYLLATECFVLPSKSETFGVAYIEALACGVPVIASKCGGPEDFVTGENGVLLDNNTVEDLANAMVYMYENAYKYDGQKMASEMKNKFSDRTIAEQLEGIYHLQGAGNE